MSPVNLKYAGDTLQNRGVEKLGKDALLKNGTATAESDATPSRRRPGRVVGESTLSNKLLLYLAFVNMEKGIGRGW